MLGAISPRRVFLRLLATLILASAPAGSIFITYYGMWHRRSESNIPSLRNNLKYNYWRWIEPTRDWIVNPDFNVSTASFESLKPTYRPMREDMYDITAKVLLVKR